MATASLLGGKGACDFCAPTVYQYDSNGHVDCTVRQPQRLDETRSSLHVASCVERKHAHATRRHTPRHDDTRHVCQMGHSGTRVGHCVSMTVLCGCTWSGCHHVIKSSSHHGITSSRQKHNHGITSSRQHDSKTHACVVHALPLRPDVQHPIILCETSQSGHIFSSVSAGMKIPIGVASDTTCRKMRLPTILPR